VGSIGVGDDISAPEGIDREDPGEGTSGGDSGGAGGNRVGEGSSGDSSGGGSGQGVGPRVEGCPRVLAPRPGRTHRSGGRDATTRSRVRELRLSQGWRLVDLAASAGVSLEVVRRAERGELLGLRCDSLLRISLALGVGAADLYPVLSPVLDRRRRSGPRRRIQRVDGMPDTG